MDEDTAYLLGLLVARGELFETENVYRIIVHFPRGQLVARGEELVFDTDKEIKNLSRFTSRIAGCPGERLLREPKEPNPQENNGTRLDPGLIGHHFDTYWQICKALGCPRVPAPGQPLEAIVEE